MESEASGEASHDGDEHAPGVIDRQLDRRYTANFMALADLGLAALCLPTVAVACGLDMSSASSRVAVAATVAFTAHAFVLLTLGGFLARLLAAAVREGSAALGDPDAALYEASRFRQKVERHLGSLPDLKNGRWYALVGVGLVPQIAFVVITGGMDKSPFAQLLLATFVLGQFRASTGKAIWGLFAIGIVTALVTHVVYLVLVRDYPDFIIDEAFKARYFIFPGALVAFASTLIYWITFKLERLPPEMRPLRD